MARAIVCSPETSDGEPCLAGSDQSCGVLVSELQGIKFLAAMFDERGVSCADVLAAAEYCAAR